MKREDYDKAVVAFNERSYDVIRMLKDAVKKIRNVKFNSPVHAPVLDNGGYYTDVNIVSLRWDDGQDTFIAIDSEDDVWLADNFLPCIYDKFLNVLLEQKRDCSFEETEMLPVNQDLLHRTIADIAYNLGWEHHDGKDSQEVVEHIVEWAKEFEKLYRQTDWENVTDYLETVEEFSSCKIAKYMQDR